MSIPGRMKSLAGGNMDANSRRTIAAAATMQVPDFTNLVYVSGTDTVTSLLAGDSTRNREVTFIGLSGTTTFTNTDNATVEGTMDLGGSNRAVGTTDVLVLILKMDGTWLMKSFTDN